MNKKTFLSFVRRQSACIAVLLVIAATAALTSCSFSATPGSTAPDDGKKQMVNLKPADSGVTAKPITLSGQKNTIPAGVGGKAEYDISTTDIDLSNSLSFITEATFAWYAAAQGGEPIPSPTGIGYHLKGESDSKGAFDVNFSNKLPAGDYYFTVTYGGATSNRAKLTVGGGSPYSTYLAGWYRNSTNEMFAYTLVNDALTVLAPPAGGNASPTAMAVSGGRTYVTGGYFATSNGATRACYWVDGAVTKLEAPHANDTDTDHTESILVSGGSIYIAGYYFYNGIRVPCYWADGTLTTLALPAGASDGVAKSIAVSDGKIYAAGHHANSSGTVTPGYWLDGSFVPLSLPTGAEFRSGETMRIAVSGNKVYVMGTYRLNSRYYPCVWTDGTRTELAPSGSVALGAVAQSMTVAGGKVYVSGYSIPGNKNYRKGCYWVDGACTDLNAPDGAWSEAASIGVVDGKVYVGGEHYGSSGDRRPCYWLDGVRTDLDIPSGGWSAGIKAIYMSE